MKYCICKIFKKFAKEMAKKSSGNYEWKKMVCHTGYNENYAIAILMT